MYKTLIKPAADWVVALALCAMLLPIMLIIALLLSISNRGNPLFLQKRPGKNGRIFTIIKFKTMSDHVDEFGCLLPDHERLTKFGRWIRATSLDELPQLFNVVIGDMSLIGPRPLLIEYLPLYNDFQRKRHLVKPGITGWAQINGRNALSWNEKFHFDIEYVENLSWELDKKIIGVTFDKVLKRHGINAGPKISMEVFKGDLL